MKTKIILALLVALAVTSGGLYVGHLRSQVTTLRADVSTLSTALQTTQRALHASESALVSLQQSEVENSKKAKAQDAKLRSALKGNPVWADSDVPPDVLSALRVR